MLLRTELLAVRFVGLRLPRVGCGATPRSAAEAWCSAAVRTEQGSSPSDAATFSSPNGPGRAKQRSSACSAGSSSDNARAEQRRNDARASVARGPSQHSTLIRDASLRVVQRSHRQQVASSAASQAASQAAQWCRNHPASAAPQAWRTTRRPSFGSPVASHSAPRRRSW
eukprot:34596-Prorocentrum_minimum.AAC.7